MVTLSRRQFETASLQELAAQLTEMKLDFRNDIYAKVSGLGFSHFNINPKGAGAPFVLPSQKGALLPGHVGFNRGIASMIETFNSSAIKAPL